MLKYAVVLMLGILLFGCVSNGGGAYNITNYTKGNPDKNLSDNTTVKPGGLGFSVPSELPIAYVGKPFTYSLNPSGGRTPYHFAYNYQKLAYDGSDRGYYLEGIPSSSDDEQLDFTPQTGDEGEYLVKICASDNGDYYYKPVCRNTTLYIMSDIVKVKGSGKVTSPVVWDPRAYIVVRGRAGDVEKSLERPERTTLVSVSQIPDVSLNVSTPPKDNNPGSPYSLGSSGGASVEFGMVADSTSVSQSVTGEAPCGSPKKDGSFYVLNLDSFQVLRETVIGLIITNDGSTEKVIDISFAGRSAVSSDSKYYYEAGTRVNIYIGDTKFDLNPYSRTVLEFNQIALNPGEEVTDSKVVRVIVTPGNHVVQIGGIIPYLDGGGLGANECPVHVSISGGVTITAVDADLSDGKLPMGVTSGSHINKID